MLVIYPRTPADYGCVKEEMMTTQVLLLESDRKPSKVWIEFGLGARGLLTVSEARELHRQLGAVLAPAKRAGKKGRKK